MSLENTVSGENISKKGNPEAYKLYYLPGDPDSEEARKILDPSYSGEHLTQKEISKEGELATLHQEGGIDFPLLIVGKTCYRGLETIKYFQREKNIREKKGFHINYEGGYTFLGREGNKSDEELEELVKKAIPFVYIQRASEEDLMKCWAHPDSTVPCPPAITGNYHRCEGKTSIIDFIYSYSKEDSENGKRAMKLRAKVISDTLEKIEKEDSNKNEPKQEPLV